MFGVLLEFVKNHWPAGVWLLLVAVLVWTVAKIYYGQFKKIENDCVIQKESINELQKLVRSLTENARCLPCVAHDGQINNIAKDIKDLSKSVNEVRGFLAAKSQKGVNIFSGKNSPRTLNDFGRRLYEDADGERFLNANKEMLFSKMDERNPQTALDVEMYANEILLVCSMDPVFNDIKNFIYNSPDMDVLDEEGRTVKRSITISDVCFVMSLPFRDMYLESHPNLADTEEKK